MTVLCLKSKHLIKCFHYFSYLNLILQKKKKLSFRFDSTNSLPIFPILLPMKINNNILIKIKKSLNEKNNNIFISILIEVLTTSLSLIIVQIKIKSLLQIIFFLYSSAISPTIKQIRIWLVINNN